MFWRLSDRESRWLRGRGAGSEEPALWVGSSGGNIFCSLALFYFAANDQVHSPYGTVFAANQVKLSLFVIMHRKMQRCKCLAEEEFPISPLCQENHPSSGVQGTLVSRQCTVPDYTYRLRSVWDDPRSRFPMECRMSVL